MFFDENLIDILKKNKDKFKDNSKIIIGKLKNVENKFICSKYTLNKLPNIFKNYETITSTNFRDTIMININNNIQYFKITKKLIYMNDNLIIENKQSIPVDSQCFPNLVKYDNHVNYIKFTIKINSDIDLIGIKKNGTIYIEIHIDNVSNIKKNDIKHINKLLKNI